MRYMLFKTYVKAEDAILSVATPSATLPLNDLSSSLCEYDDVLSLTCANITSILQQT